MKKTIILLMLIISGTEIFAQTVTTSALQKGNAKKQVAKNISTGTRKNINNPQYHENRKLITLPGSTAKAVTANKNNLASRPVKKSAVSIKHPVRLPDRKLIIQYHNKKK